MKFARLSLLTAVFLLSVRSLAIAQEPAKAPPPLQVIVFDSTGSYEDDLPKVVVQTRNSLRNDKRLEVFLFDPDSPTFTLAASSATPPISLASVQTQAQQSAVATAFGADYYVVLAPDSRGKKVAATVFSVQSGSTQSIAKPENPDSAANDIAALIESWPSSTQPKSDNTTPPQDVPMPPVATQPAPAQPVLPPVVVEAAPAPSQPVAVTPIIPAASQPSPTVSAPVVVSSPPSLAPSSAVPEAPAATSPEQEPTSPAGPPATPGSVSQATLPTPPVSTSQAPSAAAAPAAAPVLSTGDSTMVVAPTLDLSGSAASSTVATPVSLPATPTATPAAPTAAPTPAPIIEPVQAAPSSQPPPIPTVSVPPAPAPVTLPPVSQASNSLGTTSLPPSATSGPTIQITGVTIGNAGAQSATQSTDTSTSGPLLGSTITPAAQALIDQGDAAVQTSDDLTAISLYQKAISLAPRSATPRLKLAEAYVDAGMKDQATEEARRALAIDPGNTDVQNFIKDQDSGVDGPAGDVIIAQAQTESDPNNPTAWINLGDAYWNVGDPDDSLISYKRAADIDPTAILPQTRLAKLYAARAQYDESLAALRRSGPEGYPYALRIIASRSESLVGDIDDETQSFLKGTDTREVFYAKIKVTDAQAAGLADFVSKITPPAQYNISQLHRQLSTSLLAQTAAVWVDYAETNNDSDKVQAAELEKDAIEEMKTASIAEDLQARINP